MNKRWLTQVEYAERYSLSTAAVRKAVRTGRLTRRTDGLVDGSQDVRTDRSNESDESLRRESLILKNELMRSKLAEERSAIAADAVREVYSVYAEIVQKAQKKISALDLSTAHIEALKKIFEELYHAITEQIQSDSAAE